MGSNYTKKVLIAPVLFLKIFIQIIFYLSKKEITTVGAPFTGIPVRHDTTAPVERGDMLDNEKYDKRRSIRLIHYNYAQEGMYFITICVKNRECLLGEIIENEMKLNNIGKIAEKELVNIDLKFQQAKMHTYQIMPNHIHFVLELKYETKQTIGDMIRYFKGRCSFKTKINWQRNYYDHIIRNEKEYYAICDYIINNPLNWEEDTNYK